MKTKKLTYSAVLAAAALILFTVEAQVPPLTPVPGIKLGVANVVTVFALYALGPWYALCIALVRVVLGGLLTGQASAILYSLTGSLAAWLVSWPLSRLLGRERVWVVSVFGALAHNTGQLLCAVLITETAALWWYLPVLWIAAVPAGALTGLAAQMVLARLDRRTKD